MRRISALLTVVLSLPLLAQADYKQITVLGDRFCGLSDSGSVSCTSASDPTNPTLQPPEAIFTEIGLGFRHACGITDSGDVQCWGLDTHEDQIYPPGFDAPVVKLSVGSYHSCAVDSEGTAKCWGQNVHGQADVPADIDEFADVSTISYYSSCGIKGTEDLFCWGYFHSTLVPYAARTDSPFTQFESSDSIDCAVREDGTADCWSANVGNLVVAQFRNGPYRKVIPMQQRDDNVACALTDAGELDCVGRLYVGRDRNPAPLAVTRLPQTYADVHADGSRLYGYTTAGRLELVLGSQDETRQVLLDTINGELSMPVLTLSAANFYGSATGTELFFDVSGVSIHDYRRNYDTQVFRDEVLLDTTDNMGSYMDRTATAVESPVYTLRAVHAFGQTGDFSNALRPGNTSDAPDGPGSYLPVDERSASPEGLRAEVYWYDVELFWDRNTSGEVRSYEIRKNGEFIDTTSGTSWYDASTADGDLVQYEVIAMGADGALLGLDSVRVQIGDPVCR
ncbi:hypothetical protein ACUNV4_01315 [Granulosicoccus sp. 3-233]|uniref:RCC1 domain-containing protein n=1 Tax=Granulosicoccus sp. 3-233 TaxID=3417969 RepID=UPI003D343BB7